MCSPPRSWKLSVAGHGRDPARFWLRGDEDSRQVFFKPEIRAARPRADCRAFPDEAVECVGATAKHEAMSGAGPAIATRTKRRIRYVIPAFAEIAQMKCRDSGLFRWVMRLISMGIKPDEPRLKP
jgi:hypothetical protein